MEAHLTGGLILDQWHYVLQQMSIEVEQPGQGDCSLEQELEEVNETLVVQMVVCLSVRMASLILVRCD